MPAHDLGPGPWLATSPHWLAPVRALTEMTSTTAPKGFAHSGQKLRAFQILAVHVDEPIDACLLEASVWDESPPLHPLDPLLPLAMLIDSFTRLGEDGTLRGLRVHSESLTWKWDAWKTPFLYKQKVSTSM